MTLNLGLLTELIRAGMPDEASVATSTWVVPDHVEVRGELLAWRAEEPREISLALPSSPVSDGGGLALTFAALEDASEQEICDFAQEVGVLGLCGHGVPSTHLTATGAAGWRTMHCAHPYLVPVDLADGGWTVEPLERWRAYARKATGLLGVAAAFHQDRTVDPAFRARLGEPAVRLAAPWEPPQSGNLVDRTSEIGEGTLGRGRIANITVDVSALSPAATSDSVEDRRLVENELSRWMDLGGVRLSVTSDAEEFFVRFGGHTLFGAIATEMALMVSRIRTLYPCSGCGRPFVGENRNRDAKHWWCNEPTCKKKSRAEASRRSREKRRRQLGQS